MPLRHDGPRAAREVRAGARAIVFAVERAVAEKTAIMPAIAEDRFLCGFGHIFAGGYSAGYYSYLWAEVLSADAFGAFEEAGLEDDDAVKTEGTKFANTVLSLGGGVAPLEVFKSFRGGNPPSRRSSGTTDSSRRPRKDGDARRSRETRKGETRDGRGAERREISVERRTES